MLEAYLQEVGQDQPFVLAGERMGEVGEALKLCVNLLSLGCGELVYELSGANGGVCDNEAFSHVKDAK
jgi:hypothetical protein